MVPWNFRMQIAEKANGQTDNSGRLVTVIRNWKEKKIYNPFVSSRDEMERLIRHFFPFRNKSLQIPTFRLVHSSNIHRRTQIFTWTAPALNDNAWHWAFHITNHHWLSLGLEIFPARRNINALSLASQIRIYIPYSSVGACNVMFHKSNWRNFRVSRFKNPEKRWWYLGWHSCNKLFALPNQC